MENERVTKRLQKLKNGETTYCIKPQKIATQNQSSCYKEKIRTSTYLFGALFCPLGSQTFFSHFVFKTL
jgi:hypothetical protein